MASGTGHTMRPSHGARSVRWPWNVQDSALHNYTRRLSMSLDYRPRGMSMWDPWYLEHQGMVHMFYLQRLAKDSNRPQPEEDWLGHAVSPDLIHWTEHALALPPNAPGTLDDLQPWTGCVVEH